MATRGEGEQPPRPRVPARAPSVTRAPWYPVDYEKADAAAIQAVSAGTADALQQKRAMDWILKRACGLPEWAFFPGASDRDTNIALGRHFVGHQIVKLQLVNLASIPNRVAGAVPHEPQD